MKRIVAVILFSIVSIFCLACWLCACGENLGNQNPLDTPHEHVYNAVEYQAPTCVDVGYEAHFSCSCGKIFDAEKNEIEFSDIEVAATGDHVEGEWVIDKEANCVEVGSKHKECITCETVMESKEIPVTDEHTFVEWTTDIHEHWWLCKYCHDEFDRGEHKYENRVCDFCEGDKPIYYYTEDEKYICFGEYPQSKVIDDELLAALGEMVGALPNENNPGAWTDYGYLSNNEAKSYSWYIDVTYDYCRYRGVYFTLYRSRQTKNAPGLNGEQRTNGYLNETVYWFKYDPIKWRPLSSDSNSALLMSDMVLDSHEYFGLTLDDRNIDGKTVHPNNYEYSSLRAWLTTEFYNVAFDDVEREYIQLTQVDNSITSTIPGERPEYYGGYTEDYVFVPSIGELTNTSYGFKSDQTAVDPARQLRPSEYAKAQGLSVQLDYDYNYDLEDDMPLVEFGCFYTRSPIGVFEYWEITSPTAAYSIGSTGERAWTVLDLTYEGVVPMLNLKLA